MKENDYLLSILANPEFNHVNFKNVGLTTENTSLEKPEVYKNLDYVKENPLVQTNGEFDEAKFDKLYKIALESYNLFANNETSELIAKELHYRGNIFVDEDERRQGYDTKIYREANPLRLRVGLTGSNSVNESPLSVREIAQTLKVWDPSTESWQDAPNDSWISNWTETRVLALYDEDGEHEDPFTGRIVKHKKGDKKLNHNGTFYYENLDGRDVYGREVLSKFDTLTRDGSWVNLFDFFDSDDKDKSFAGSLTKNVLKVLPAISPIAPWYIGARVALNTTELLSKLSKMFAGTENKTLNSIEGYVKSLGFSKSDYAQGSSEANIAPHAWSMENILSMGADAFLQLYEQRWIFKQVPALFKGKYDKEAMDKLKKTKLDEFAERNNTNKRLQEALNSKTLSAEEKAKHLTDLMAINSLYALQAVDAFGKSYQQIGKYVSQAYMTGITVLDSYREAIEEGAEPWEAALLTLGYAIGEYKIINSDLGKWILPELKAQRMKMKEAARWVMDVKKPANSASTLDKMNWVSTIVNKGRELADKTYNHWGTDLIGNLTAGAISEGFEEVTEELWYDVAKSLYNVSAYLGGKDTRLTAFNDIADRYGLSFVGGMLGGAIASAPSDFRNIKNNKITSKDLAYQYIVHEIKEGNANELRKTFRNMTLNSDALAAEGIDEYGNAMPFDGTSGRSQNAAALQQLINMVDMIEDILNANGAMVDDASLLNTLVNGDKDFRFLALKQSTFAANYLQDYNTLVTDIVGLSDQIQKLQTPPKDSLADEVKETNKGEIAKLSAQLKEKLQQLQDFVNGKRAGEYIEKALFEMSEDLSSIFLDVNKVLWIKSQSGEDDISKISPERLKVLEKQWNDWSRLERKDKLELAFNIFKHVNLQASLMLQKYDSSYFQLNEDNIINTLSNLFGARYAALNASQETGEGFIHLATEGVDENFDASKSKYVMFADAFIKAVGEEVAGFLNIQRLNYISQLSPKEQESEIMDIIEDLLRNEVAVNTLIEHLNSLPYLSYNDKMTLHNVIDIKYPYELINGEYGIELSDEAFANISKLIKIIDNKPSSPIMELINSWSNSLSNTDISVQKLMNLLEILYNTLSSSGKLEEFSMNDMDERRIKTVLNNIKLLKASVLAARTDGVNTSNRVGYNVTVNELLKEGLAEIDKNTAYVILQDINKLEERIKFYAKIHEINSGLKLIEHNKVAVNNAIITYNALKKYVFEHDWPPKEWKGVNELKLALQDGLEIINTLDDGNERSLSLSQVQRQSLQRDIRKIDSAFHKFFKDNVDLVNNPDKLAGLFNSDLFNFKDLDKSVLNKYTESMNDTLLVWWLATRAAMDPEAFYSTFKDSFINGLAPIAAQEQAIMTSVAGVLNNKVFSNFAKAYNKSLEELAKKGDDYFKNLDRNYRNFLQNDYLDSDVAIQFFRHFLIEGIAGSGKTSAVAREIVTMLSKSDAGKELLSNVWFVHTTKEEALKWAENLGFGENYENSFSREEYLEKIAPGVNKLRKITDEGLELNKLDLVRRPGESLYHYNLGINKGLTSNIPSLVMMDEVSGFSQQDLLLSEDFSNYYGHSNLVFGDFDQDGLEGRVENITAGVNLESQIFRGNFAGASKLGDSLRTTNGVKDFNNKQVQANIDDLRKDVDNKKGISLNFKWYTDGNVILGDKVYKDYSKLDAIKLDIIKLLDNVPEHEQLGYVYNNKNSEIYKWLELLNSDGKYKGKINFKEGSSSQGQEADFYVVDLEQDTTNREKTNSKFWKQVYTGITRARRGTISIIQSNNVNEFGPSEEIAGEFSLKSEAISSFSEQTKKIYDSVYDTPMLLKYTRFSGERKVNTVLINGENYNVIPNKFTISKTFEYEGQTHTVKGFVSDGTKDYVWTNAGSDNLYEIDDFKNNVLPKIKTVVSEELSTEEAEQRAKIDEENSDKVDINNNDEAELNMLLHSFATNETGLIEENGRYKISIGADKRIDGAYGVMRLLGISPDSEGYISEKDYQVILRVLQPLRAAALYEKDKSGIIQALSTVKGIAKNLKNPHVRLIFKSHYMPGKNPNETRTEEEYYSSPKRSGFLRWCKSVKEKVISLFTKEGTHVEPTQKTISLLVTDYDGNTEKGVLEIPLLNLTNPLTIANTAGFEEISSIIQDVTSNFEALNKEYSGRDVLLEVRDKLRTKPAKMSESFLKLTDLYLGVTDNSVVLLDDIILNKYSHIESDNEITLSNIFEPTGMLITNKQKGENWYDEDLTFDGRWMPLTEYMKMSEKLVTNVYAAAQDIKDGDGNVIVEAGHYFVLVTDAVHKFRGTSDEDMIKAFYEQYKPGLSKYFKLVRVTPPTSTIEEYFLNLNSVYKKNEETDTTIGTVNTAFDILSYLLEDDVLRDKILDPYLPNYEKLKDLVGKIRDLKSTLSSKDFIDLLAGNGEIDGLTLQQFTEEVYGYATKSPSWKSYLLNQLRWLVLSDSLSKYNFNITPENDSQRQIMEKVQRVKEYLKTRNINGIFYSPSLDTTKKEIHGFIPIVNDNGTFKGKPFMINGKIDSLAYKGNTRPLIDGILDAYNTVSYNGATVTQNHVSIYANDLFKEYAPSPKVKQNNINEEKEIQDITDNLYNLLFKNSYKLGIKSIIKSEVKQNKALTLQDLELVLINKGYFARVLDDGTLYVKKDSDIKVVDRDTVEKDGIIYKYQGFGSNGAEFAPENPISQDSSTFLKDLLNLDYLKRLDAGLSSIDSAPVVFTGVTNFEDLMLNSSEIFKQWFIDAGIASSEDISDFVTDSKLSEVVLDLYSFVNGQEDVKNCIILI